MTDDGFWPADPDDDLCPCRRCNDGPDTVVDEPRRGEDGDSEQQFSQSSRRIFDLSERPIIGRIDQMVSWVSGRIGLSAREITGACRQVEHVRARFAIMWVARRATGLSTVTIGRRLGDRDHTTVINGLRSADRLRASHSEFRALTDALLEAFTPSETKEQIHER